MTRTDPQGHDERLLALARKLEALAVNPVALLGLALAAERAYRDAGPPERLAEAVDADTLVCLEAPGFRAALQRLAMTGPSPALDRVAEAIRGRTRKAKRDRARRAKGLAVGFDAAEVDHFEGILRRADTVAGPFVVDAAEIEAALRSAPGAVPPRLVAGAAQLIAKMRRQRHERGPLPYRRGAVRLAAFAHGEAPSTVSKPAVLTAKTLRRLARARKP